MNTVRFYWSLGGRPCGGGELTVNIRGSLCDCHMAKLCKSMASHVELPLVARGPGRLRMSWMLVTDQPSVPLGQVIDERE